MVDQRRDELLDEERVSLSAVHNRGAKLSGKLGRQQLPQEHVRLIARERLEPEKRGVAPSPAPRRSAVEQLGSRRADQEQRPVHVAYEALDQIEQIVFGPVEVLDQDDSGSFADEDAEKIDPCLLERVTRGERVELRGGVEAERQPENLSRAEALPHGLRRIALADPKVLLEPFSECPVGDAPPIRETATCAGERLRLPRLEPLPELAHEARLPYPAVTDDCHEMRLALLDCVLIARAEQAQLALASDERVPQPRDSARTSERHRAEDALAGNARGLSFRLGGQRPIELERATRSAHGPLPREDLARSGRLLESSRHVHGITTDEGASFPRHADHDFPGVHANSELELVGEQLLLPVLHGERRMESPLCVILLRGGRPEGRHHRVAG